MGSNFLSSQQISYDADVKVISVYKAKQLENK